MAENRRRALETCQPPMELAFTKAEYDARLTRIRARMEADGLDMLWLMAPESLYWVSGYKCEWYQAQGPKQWPATSGIAIHRDHDRFILFDTPSEQIMCRFVTCSTDTRIFPITTRRDGIGFIIDELTAEGWMSGTVGLEFHSYRPNPTISRRFVAAFEGAGMRVADGSDVLRDLRWVKSPAEIACLERAAEIAQIGLDAAAATIRPGVTELEVYGEIIRAMAKAGGENPAITLPVLSGLKANTGHSLASRKVIEAGEQVSVDVSGVFERYHANAARAFWVGEPPKHVREFHTKSAGVFEVIDGLLRPGLSVAELVRAARRYFDDVGIWSDAAWVGGYELGLAFPPDWVGNYVYEMSDTETDKTFEPGTAVNFESQFFAPDLAGITYYIDMLLFREDRAYRPIPAPTELVALEA